MYSLLIMMLIVNVLAAGKDSRLVGGWSSEMGSSTNPANNTYMLTWSKWNCYSTALLIWSLKAFRSYIAAIDM